MPEDLAHLKPEEQQYHVKMRAAYLMTVGTALVLIFSGKPRSCPPGRRAPSHDRIRRIRGKFLSTDNLRRATRNLQVLVPPALYILANQAGLVLNPSCCCWLSMVYSTLVTR